MQSRPDLGRILVFPDMLADGRVNSEGDEVACFVEMFLLILIVREVVVVDLDCELGEEGAFGGSDSVSAVCEIGLEQDFLCAGVEVPEALGLGGDFEGFSPDPVVLSAA